MERCLPDWLPVAPEVRGPHNLSLVWSLDRTLTTLLPVFSGFDCPDPIFPLLRACVTKCQGHLDTYTHHWTRNLGQVTFLCLRFLICKTGIVIVLTLEMD